MSKMSFILDDKYVKQLEDEIKKRQKWSKKSVSKAEIVREYVVKGLDKTVFDRSISTKPLVEEPNTGEIQHEIKDIKESLNNILTIVSYPQELDILNKKVDKILANVVEE